MTNPAEQAHIPGNNPQEKKPSKGGESLAAFKARIKGTAMKNEAWLASILPTATAKKEWKFKGGATAEGEEALSATSWFHRNEGKGEWGWFVDRVGAKISENVLPGGVPFAGREGDVAFFMHPSTGMENYDTTPKTVFFHTTHSLLIYEFTGGKWMSLGQDKVFDPTEDGTHDNRENWWENDENLVAER
ncbi:hypothetical protein COY07_02270 [Candidatus Peregrinibacteria bacterium CG_4_10_14_0_2_um_filter_43_11]|nr:MAG: hypothetical protein COY07_02270 [Candidatus Peregrinibacteria bacterium CG_4_10_14_0_2_um_filter_43_11]